MKKHTILVDLSIAMNKGYCGIAKENRLMFQILSEADNIKADGLLTSPSLMTVFSNYRPSSSKDKSIEQTNHFFHEVLDHEPLLKAKLLKKLTFAAYFFLKKNKFNLFDIDPLFHQTVWRNVFDKSLSATDQASILKNRFTFSNLTSIHTKTASYFKKALQLDTSRYDFAVFLEPTPVSVSPNTIKIVRYHDAIPITEPDFSDTIYSHNTINALQLCARDSYFVCNSEPTRDILLTLKPELESNTFMIPVAITNHYKRVHNEETLKQIMLMRLSTQVIKPDYLPQIRQNIQESNGFKYIFNLAALDPKKNIASLIRAWEKLYYQQKCKVKLVIAANSGWFSKDIEQMMLPHVELGNIIHLNNLSIDELPYLFSHAEAFIFPSYTEGFGLPPLEASQCNCPVIVSDIPAHRWVMGDSALYCDPYNVDSIVDTLALLLCVTDKEARKQTLIKHANENVKRFHADTLKPKWHALFDDVRTRC